MQIKGKVAIVTGASGGIGLSVAKLLGAKGAKVVLVARRGERLTKIAKTLPGSLAVPTDISREEEITAMLEEVLEHYGRIDILINNAGRGYDAPIEKTNIQTLLDIFALDIIGPLVTMQRVIPIMRREGMGSIVNISSGTSLMVLPNMGAYSGLKRALAQISLTAHEELKKDKITVSVVYPYITATDFEKNTIKEKIVRNQRGGGSPPFPPDPPELVAKLVLEAIKTGAPELFAHDWMKKL